jgi:Family of unknown function (DUF6186)
MTSRFIVIRLFLVFAVAFAVVEFLSRREGSRVPSLADLSGFVMQYQVGRVPVGRVAVLGFWWWIGWHFFAR